MTTRRGFLKTGALLAMPIAARAVAAIATTTPGDEAAIRALHQAWLHDVNRGAVTLIASGSPVRALAPDHHGAPDAITLAGARAQGRFACTVEVARSGPDGGTFAQMARLQGNAGVCAERRIVNAEYVKSDGRWQIARVRLA